MDLSILNKISLPIFKRNPQGKPKLDLQEVFNLWSLLQTRYKNVEAIQIFRNFIHDRDLQAVVDQVMEEYQRQMAQAENEVKSFAVKMMERPPVDVKTSQPVEALSDGFIFIRIYELVRNDLFHLSRAMRTTTTNDRLRSILRGFLTAQLDIFELLVKYGKVKEWLDIAPTFKTARAVKKEKLDVAEAYHLVDHLTLRYDQIQLTQFFASFAHDPEYAAILKAGLHTLEAQVKRLEKIALEMEVPLPKRPPVSVKTPADPETIEDVFTYRTIYRGIQEAVDLHLRAIVESTRNDSLRQLFSDFFAVELDINDKLIKYGKAKGWPHQQPLYISQT